MTACPSSGGLRAAALGRQAAFAAFTALAFSLGGPDPVSAQTRGPILLGPPTPLGPAAPGSEAGPSSSAPPLFAPPSVDTAAPAAPAARTTADGAIRIEGLSRLTADAVGTLTPESGGLRTDLWQGTPGPIALRLVALLPGAPNSQAIRDLQRRLLLSSGPGPSGLAREGAMLAARAERLLAMGAVDELGALAKTIPGRVDDEALARPLAERAAATGDDATACGYHDAVAARADDRFWVKLGIVCDLWRGDTAKAELGVRLLGEIGETDGLLQDLVQAAVSGAGKAGGPTRLVGAGPLHLAAARLAKVTIDRCRCWWR